MKLLFKQRFFSWFDSYDIYDEEGNTVFTVKGQLAWGHCLKIYDANDQEIGTVKEKIFTFMPRFEIYVGGRCIGNISKEFTFFKPKYNIDFNGWSVDGEILEWNYTVSDNNTVIAKISKELWNLTDTYVMDIVNPQDAMGVLMLVLAIDAEKDSRN